MLIHSFIKSTFGFRPVQVEVVLTPGVSQIQILGMPDQLIKESSQRIKSALRHQGFQIPAGKQVLVNLHASPGRKTSLGLDLPIALGILLESQQISSEVFDFEKGYCYGALSLKGEVVAPEDIELLNYENFNKNLLTGPLNSKMRFPFYQLDSLGDLENILRFEECPEDFLCQSFELNEEIQFEDSMARLMTLVAAGEHPLLIAGHAGCGKTTLVENLGRLLDHPDPKDFLQSKKYWKLSGRELSTRPLVQPHHSATPIAMIGGGSSLRFGEISLAHGGALILDELLEFHPQVQGSLREPMEKGVIYLSRAGQRVTFPARFLALATTNLCPCGQFQPGSVSRCRCSSQKLRSYVERLTGPFLDRFAIFHLYQKSKLDFKVGLKHIKAEVEKACRFRESSREQKRPNHFLNYQELKAQLDSKIMEEMIPHSKSQRRRLQLLRVARTLADLEESGPIKLHHLEEAQAWSAKDIYKLERFRIEDFMN